MRVVIVGGGFGGVRCAHRLANKPGFDVRLISDKPYFTYHAALYRSATGRSPMEVAIPLEEFFSSASNVEVVEDKIEKIEPKQKLAVGASKSTYRYDRLVLAPGSVTQYFGIKGLRELSYGIKSIDEALELKRHLHSELAEKPSGKTNYVVVGAGASGVELAAELVTYLKRIRRRHKLSGKSFNVVIVEASDRILPMLPQSFTKRVHKRLKKLGVKIHLNTFVKGESKDQLNLPGGNIKTHSVIWTAGMTNNPLFANNKELFRLDKSGRVAVNGQLQSMADVYVIGDSVKSEYGGMAQTALHQADFVASDLLGRNKTNGSVKYSPKRPIYAIPVGPYWTAVLWGNVKIYGLLGWLLRRLADLRLYLEFMPLTKALSIWRYGYTLEEACPQCK